jgi:AcrR family transcriptional regulator
LIRRALALESAPVEVVLTRGKKGLVNSSAFADSYIRMNESARTRDRLLTAARTLFARQGYRGTSVKAITARARANLGAITYHYGSKESLYHEVLRDVGEPLAAAVAAAAQRPGCPLERLEGAVRAYFGYVCSHPDLPGLMLHELSLGRPAPPPLRRILGMMFQQVSALVVEGQRTGVVVGGDPRLLTISVLAPSVHIAIAHRFLRTAASLDLRDSRAQRNVIEHLVAAMRRMLSPVGRERK